MTPRLDAQALTFAVGGVPLVADVSLALEAGTVTILVGPNGAGKSTLLGLLAGGRVPDAGTVRLGGTPLGAMPPWRLACARAVLPQGGQVSAPFTAYEVAALGGAGIGRAASRSHRHARVEAALARADVLHLGGRPYASLSGGEQQRVQFARVLCQLAAGRAVEPGQVLFLDEPIAALDLKHQIALLRAVRDLAGDGLAVLAIIHDLNLAAAFADQLLVLSRGRLVAGGAPAAVLTDALLADVFEVDLKVRAVPEPPVPFVVPHP